MKTRAYMYLDDLYFGLGGGGGRGEMVVALWDLYKICWVGGEGWIFYYIILYLEILEIYPVYKSAGVIKRTVCWRC